MGIEKIEDTVRKLADENAIRDLARRYAHYVWRKDVAGAIGLFTADGEMDTGDRPPIKGKAALAKAYEAMITGPDFLPFVHNHIVELDGDAASGTCYLDLRAAVEGKSMIGAGYYDDEYLRVNGEWKFRSRKLTMNFFVPLSEGWTKS